MLDLSIIKPSKREMANLIVCVLNGKAGQDDVCIALDYRYLNKHCESDAYPLPNVDDVILKETYLNIQVKSVHQWLTAFVWDESLYEFTRAPNGQKGSGCTFVRVLQQVLQPIKKFAESYVNDISVFSNLWRSRLAYI